MRGSAPDRGTPAPRTGRPGRHASPPAGRRRTIALLVAAVLVAGIASVLGQNLIPGRHGDPPPARPLSSVEADRLASMRQLNWQDQRAGVRATVGEGAEQVHLTGWVDWRRPLVYLARSGATAGVVTELVQAVPGLVATRPKGAPAAVTAPTTDAPSPGRTDPSAGAPPTPTGAAEVLDPHPPPPTSLPADGWQLRQPGADGPAGAPAAPGTIDALTVLLLMITSEEPDVAALLADSESHWLRRDRTAGHDVDVLLGPAVPPSPPPPGPAAPGRAPDSSLAAMGGAVQYWLDDQARLHRLEALLAPGTPVRVELDRDDPTAPAALDLLGGAAIDPRPVTDQEVDRLAQLRPRNQAAGGGEVTLAVPAKDGAMVRATGWLDWQQSTVYLARYRDGAPDGLLWAERAGVATRSGKPADDGGPPLPVAPGSEWKLSAWEERADDQGGYDLDLLLNEVLSLAGPTPDQPKPVREHARWLRSDRLRDARVDVFEIPRPAESTVEPGEARVRYWVDRDSGVLRRLELRGRTGGYAHLDLDPGPVPALG
ncbi:MAG: hypothetical protein GEV12_03185 [Micromonosporaceae bacterium]|nr:hypothetical protein [Micromonosporaceae bacterium]